jgi:salicylate biosynthesis isochorismate synthase
MLGAGASFSSAADGPGRSFHLAEAAARIGNACVSGGDSGNSPALPVVLLQLAFEQRTPGPGHWGDGLPGARLVLPRRAWWQRRSGQGYIIDTIAVSADDTLADLAERMLDEPVAQRPTTPAHPWPALCTTAYEQLVEEAVALIEHGAMRKVVLARACDHHLQRAPDIASVLAALHSTADAWTYSYAIDLDDDACFIGATPELLFHLDGASCHTVALAGSRPRGHDADHDEALAAELLASTKERKEHQLVVEHLVHQLRVRSSKLSVPQSPSLRRLARLQHLETQLSCRLRDPDPFDLMAALHPTPAVAGLPSEAAIDFIHRREGLHRGLYTGTVGYATPTSTRMVVPLRGGIVRGQEARLFAGAGIVDTSEPQAELAETELKLRPMQRALGLDG